MTARLEITDGTTVIDLIQTGGNPFFLSSWRPAIIQPKGGGTYQQSSLSDGRRLVDRKFNNATETFDLVVRGFDPDALAAALQDLRMLLDKAVSYWTTNYQNTPVYLIAQSDCEEYERYAIIHNWSTPEDENPYAQPFQQGDGQTVVDSWTLIVERGDWMENPPGDSTCVETSGTQATGLSTYVISYPLITNDDCYVSETDGTIALGTANLLFGNLTAQSRNSGVRFRSVQVPADATIVTAFVKFTSGAANAGTTCNAIVYGERNDEPAAFSTYANFQGRTRTTNGIAWNGIAAWVAGNTYNTPDLTDVIQEIVNLGNWERGDDIVIFVEDNGSDNAAYRSPASIDSGVYDEPELHIVYSGRVAGRTATCENEVYIANKHNVAQLTNIRIDDGGAFDPLNYIGQPPPYSLLPAVPAVNDAVYFGIDTTDADLSGPFDSLVFDIETAQTNITDTSWQYYNGAWVNIPGATDWTAGAAGAGVAFSRTGVYSVKWVIPGDWTVVAVDGDTGYWVRLVVDAVDPGPTAPVQQNRDVYTVVWPYVEVQAAQAMGNLPALARIMALQEDTNASGIKRIFCGLRSYSRGANFTTTLNASDEQNYAGVTVTPGANTSIVNFLNSPTGRVAEYNPAGADAIATRLTFTLSAALTQEYLGAFHAFLRYDLSGATTTYTVSMVVLSDGGYTDVFTSETKAIAAGPTSGYGIVDLGAVRLPPYAEQADIGEYGRTHIAIQIGSSNGTDNFDIIDLWLMPVDEWAMDAQIASDLMILPTASRFDSLRYPRRILRAGIFDIDYTTMLETFSVRKNGPAILQANARQRLWFLMFKIDITDHEESFLQHQMRVQLFRNQRYFSYRGNR